MKSFDRANRTHLLRLLAGCTLLVAASCGYSAEERALQAGRDDYRLEMIEVMESFTWPAGYESRETLDQGAGFHFEEAYGGGNIGYYGYRLEGPTGSSPTDWFEDIHSVLMASGDVEAWSRRTADEPLACEENSAWRTYLHVPTNELLNVRTDRNIEPDQIAVQIFYGPRVSGSFDESRRVPRAGPVC